MPAPTRADGVQPPPHLGHRVTKALALGLARGTSPRGLLLLLLLLPGSHLALRPWRRDVEVGGHARHGRGQPRLHLLLLLLEFGEELLGVGADLHRGLGAHVLCSHMQVGAREACSSRNAERGPMAGAQRCAGSS